MKKEDSNDDLPRVESDGPKYPELKKKLRPSIWYFMKRKSWEVSGEHNLLSSIIGRKTAFTYISDKKLKRWVHPEDCPGGQYPSEGFEPIRVSPYFDKEATVYYLDQGKIHKVVNGNVRYFRHPSCTTPNEYRDFLSRLLEISNEADSINFFLAGALKDAVRKSLDDSFSATSIYMIYSPEFREEPEVVLKGWRVKLILKVLKIKNYLKKKK